MVSPYTGEKRQSTEVPVGGDVRNVVVITEGRVKRVGLRYHQKCKPREQERQRIVPAARRSVHCQQRIAGQRKKTAKFFKQQGLMSERIKFDIDCPNNHNQTVAFTQQEFEDTLKSGALVFHCNTCDTDWPASHEEIVKFRKVFSQNSGLHSGEGIQ